MSLPALPDAPAVVQAGLGHRLAHGLTAEDDGFDGEEAGVAAKDRR